MVHRHLTLALALALLLAVLTTAAHSADPLAKAPAEPPSPSIETSKTAPDDRRADVESSTQLTDPVEPFTPLRPRTSREEDRIRALALFAAGRVAEQQQKYPEALRYYQRAFRFDPGATAALKEIVPLAFTLDRQAEAVRYALILAEHEPSDPVLLRRLAIYATENGDTDRAVSLYEKALALQAAKNQSPSLLLSRMELGRLYFVAKQSDKAANEFAIVLDALNNPEKHGLSESMQKAVAGKPELTYQLMGESFLAAGRPDEALAAFEKRNEAKPNEGLYAYNRARVDLKQKRPAQALAKLQPYFLQHLATQGTAPYQVLADALAELGQADQLIDRLEKIHADDAQNAPLSYYLAQQYREAHELDKAEPIYADLIARNPSRPPIEAFQGLIAVQHERKDADKLLATLGEAVGRVRTFAPLGASGKAVLQDAEMSKALIEAANRQLDADAEKLPYGSRLTAALLATEQKDFDAVGKFFDLAIAANSDKAGETLVTWGLDLFLADQYAQAAEVFQRGLDEKLLPGNEAALYFYLAGALEMDGRTDDALEAARMAAESKVDSPRFTGRAAWIQYHAKRYEDARKSYLEMIEKNKDKYNSAEAREALRNARLVLSNISVLENNLPQSEEWLEELLDEFPEDIGALNDLGYLWADSGKHLDIALLMIQKAVADDPKNMAYRDSLGWVLFRLGRYDEATAELKVAAASEKPDGVILDHLGDALQKSGDLPGAIDAWLRAAESFDQNAEQQKAEQARQKIEHAKQEQEQEPEKN